MATLRSRLGTAAVAIAVVATALVSFATASGADTFGQTTIGASTARPGAGYKFGSLFTVASAGTTTSLSFYARGGTSSQQFVPVVYRVDASNNPTTLVTSGATTTIAANQAAGWVTVPLPSVALTAGTYLLGWVSGSTDVSAFLYYDTVTNAGVWAGATFPTAPASWGTPINRENIRWSIYLTYTASGGGAVPVNTAVPTISGTPQSGSSLTATTGTWSNSPTTYAYQWLRCNSAGASCVNIGTNANTYALVAADVASTIRVQVTASNATGPGTPAQSVQTAVVTAPASPPVNLVLPTITGTAAQGSTLTSSSGTWTNAPTAYAYQWMRCNAAGASCTNIGTNANTYALVAADVASTIRVQVTASNAAGPGAAVQSVQTAVVTGPPAVPVNSVLPAITGTAQVGSTLTSSTGTWSNSPTAYAYQWLRCNAAGASCTNIGTNANTYALVAADLASTIRVQVTASNAGGPGTAVQSVQTSVVANVPVPVNSVLPAITGTAQVGSTLTSSTGTWSNSPTAYAYQWLRCNAAGASCVNIGTNASTYALVAADVASTIRVQVTASNAGGAGTGVQSAQTAVVAAAPSSNKFGQQTPGANSVAPDQGYKFGSSYTLSEAGTTQSFSWYVRGGSVAQSFVPAVYAADASGNPTTLLATGAAVTVAASAPANWVTSTLPSVSLAAGTYYLALISGPTTGGAANYYDVVANAGRWNTNAYPTPSATWGTNNTESIRWSFYVSYAPAGPPVAPVNTALPTISGAAAQGTTLSATTGTWSGSPTAYAYQWLRCNAAGASCVNIGTNANTYALVAADVASTIRVQVTASNAAGPGAPVQSAQTAVVTGPPPVPVNTALPTISGTTQAGQTLNATSGTWTNSPTAYAYQWLRCNTAGTGCLTIGTNAASYVLVAADVSFTIRVQVTASNAGGPGTGVQSAQTAVVAAAPSSNKFGQQTPGANSVAPDQGYKFGSSYTLTEAATTQSFSWYVRGGSVAQSFVPAIYATDVSGNPTTLMATGAAVTVAASAAANWVTSTLPSVSLAAGNYYLALISGPTTGGAANYYDVVANAGRWNTNAYPTPSATWGTNNTESIRWSFYVTYTPSAPPSAPPVNTTLPTVTGTPQQGSTLAASTGTWTNSPSSYAYQWLRCNSAGASCVNIGTNTNSYTLVAGDVGSTIRVRVTASNSAGPGTAVQSVQTAVVTATPPVTLTPGDHGYSEVIGGRTRTWTLMVPSQISSGPLPLVVVLHGADYTGAGIRADTGYDTPAQRDGFIVAYPDGFGGTWNDGRNNVDSVAHINNIDDVGFLSQMIAEAIATGAVNQSRVYITGFSNGAMMAGRMACERTTTFAAAALVAGFGPGDPALSTVCSPSKGLPLMSVASTSDPIIPYNGGAITSQGNGNRGISASAAQLLSLWRTKNGCTSTTSSNVGGSPFSVTRIDSVGCGSGTAVRHDVYANPNHIWMRETNYDTTETTWAFLRTFALA